MVEWEDWKFIYRHFIYANISRPSCNERFWDRVGVKTDSTLKINARIDLFDEITSDLLNYEDTISIIRDIFLLTFNYIHGQALTLAEFSGIFVAHFRQLWSLNTIIFQKIIAHNIKEHFAF